jgi:mono/diheme cytochrome c family protein
MKHLAKLVILAIAPLLTAALWMDRQPSHKPYQAPLLVPPSDSVPISGREVVSRESEPHNPVAASRQSLEQGKAHFAINCAMCHGQTSLKPGPVGQKLAPPAPGLAQGVVQERSDATLFKTITFGFGRMPPFKDKLSPRERWDLVNFLRTRK